MVPMSLRSGTFRSWLSPSESKVAQSIGNAAFFEPLMRTRPASGFPPRMRIPSMFAVYHLSLGAGASFA